MGRGSRPASRTQPVGFKGRPAHRCNRPEWKRASELNAVQLGSEPSARTASKRAKLVPSRGIEPDQKFTKLLHCHCASRAGVDTRCCPEIYAVTKRRPAVERYPPSEWSRAPESNRTERLCRPRHSRSAIATCWHAPKDLNPGCGGWDRTSDILINSQAFYH